MKATGIVRRIDDLGRIVIPKDIRSTMGLREGDPLEVFIVEDGVVFKKYDTTAYKEKDAQKWLEDNCTLISRTFARFTIEGYTTVCECIRDGRRVVGTTKCNPHDSFSPSVGMVYAFCRASGTALPAEW